MSLEWKSSYRSPRCRYAFPIGNRKDGRGDRSRGPPLFLELQRFPRKEKETLSPMLPLKRKTMLESVRSSTFPVLTLMLPRSKPPVLPKSNRQVPVRPLPATSCASTMLFPVWTVELACDRPVPTNAPELPLKVTCPLPPGTVSSLDQLRVSVRRFCTASAPVLAILSGKSSLKSLVAVSSNRPAELRIVKTPSFSKKPLGPPAGLTQSKGRVTRIPFRERPGSKLRGFAGRLA